MDTTERRFLLAAIKQALACEDVKLEWYALQFAPMGALSLAHFVSFDTGFVIGLNTGRQVGQQEEQHRDKRERRKREKRHKNRSQR